MRKEFTDNDVIQFLTNPKNRKKCKECPYNEGFSSGSDHNQYPCGQYNCWVSLHVKRVEK